MLRIRGIKKAKGLLLSLFCLFSILTNIGVNQIIGDDDINTTFYQPTSPSLTIDSSDDLYLLYKENFGNRSKLALMNKTDPYVWNTNRTILVDPENDTTVYSQPYLTCINDDLFIVYSLYSEDNSSLRILKRSAGSLDWKEVYSLNNESCIFATPKIAEGKNNSYWITWTWDIEGTFGVYYGRFNITENEMYNITKLSGDDDLYDSIEPDFAVDFQGNAHIVWAQGQNYSKILRYCVVNHNNTIELLDNLTESTDSCREPALVFEVDGTLNLFYSNYTTETHVTLGTRFIYQCKKPFNQNWTDFEEVAPYIPVDKSYLSDAHNPYVIIDKSNVLWMGHEIRAYYPNFQGTALRGRMGNQWIPSEPITLGMAPAFDPQLVCDSYNHLHCVWADFRLTYFTLMYRIRKSDGVWLDEYLLIDYMGKETFGPYAKLGIIITVIGLAVASSGVVIYQALVKRRRRKILNQHKSKISQNIE